MPVEIKIAYTSDIHGHLSSHDFLSGRDGPFGLSRLATFLSGVREPLLYIDNGDSLQGSPLLNLARERGLPNPVAETLNRLDCRYVTPGNHDFNYGLAHYDAFRSSLSATVLCANVLKEGRPYFTPYAIHEISGIRLALIGLTTEYVPFWERPEHIEGLEFVNAVEAVKRCIRDARLKERSDLLVVLYHGGYEKNPGTGEAYPNPSAENRGFALFQIPEVDVLLTGHQHVPQVYAKGARVTAQTGFNGSDAGLIRVTAEREGEGVRILSIEPELVSLANFPPDTGVEGLLRPLVLETEAYLGEQAGEFATDMGIDDPLSARARNHPLFQLVNEIQREITGAEISCASLPNDTPGFPRSVSLRDIAAAFPYENDLVTIELSGKALLEALEQNATYFTLEGGKIAVNPRFLFPKVEHYNYDVYDGLYYEIHLSREPGKRVRNVRVGTKPLEERQLYTVAMNSYRATGAGGFDAFRGAKRLRVFPVSYQDLVRERIEGKGIIAVETRETFRIVVDS